MNGIQIIRDIMRNERVNLSKLGQLTHKSPQNMCNILNGKSPKVDTFVELVKAMGYRVYVTTEDCNGYEVGGDQVYSPEQTTANIRSEITDIKARLDALESRMNEL